MGTCLLYTSTMRVQAFLFIDWGLGKECQWYHNMFHCISLIEVVSWVLSHTLYHTMEGTIPKCHTQEHNGTLSYFYLSSIFSEKQHSFLFRDRGFIRASNCEMMPFFSKNKLPLLGIVTPNRMLWRELHWSTLVPLSTFSLFFYTPKKACSTLLVIDWGLVRVLFLGSMMPFFSGKLPFLLVYL